MSAMYSREFSDRDVSNGIFIVCRLSQCRKNCNRQLGEGGDNFHTQNRTKEMFYLTTHSTHFIYSYKDHSDSERANSLPPHGLLFPISSMGSLYASSHSQDNTYHGLCYTSRGALAETRNSSIGPPLKSLNR